MSSIEDVKRLGQQIVQLIKENKNTVLVAWIAYVIVGYVLLNTVGKIVGVGALIVQAGVALIPYIVVVYGLSVRPAMAPLTALKDAGSVIYAGALATGVVAFLFGYFLGPLLLYQGFFLKLIGTLVPTLAVAVLLLVLTVCSQQRHGGMKIVPEEAFGIVRGKLAAHWAAFLILVVVIQLLGNFGAGLVVALPRGTFQTLVLLMLVNGPLVIFMSLLAVSVIGRADRAAAEDGQ